MKIFHREKPTPLLITAVYTPFFFFSTISLSQPARTKCQFRFFPISRISFNITMKNGFNISTNLNNLFSLREYKCIVDIPEPTAIRFPALQNKCGHCKFICRNRVNSRANDHTFIFHCSLQSRVYSQVHIDIYIVSFLVFWFFHDLDSVLYHRRETQSETTSKLTITMLLPICKTIKFSEKCSKFFIVRYGT